MRKFVFIAMLLLAGFSANAQRTSKGQSFISLDALYTTTHGIAVGGNVEFGQYLLNSYWDCGITAANRTSPLNLGGRMEYCDYIVYGDFMYRFVGTRDRRLSFYGGGGIFLGYEAYDQMGKLPDNIDTGLGRGSFYYGVRPQLLLEVFVSRQVALALRGRVPLNWCAPHGWINYEVGLGGRITLI